MLQALVNKTRKEEEKKLNEINSKLSKLSQIWT